MENNTNNNKPAANVKHEQVLRQAQNKITVALVLGPVSLLLGGVFLSLLGLLFGCLGMRSLNKLKGDNAQAEISDGAKAAYKKAKIACVICAVAFVLNAISLYLLYPMVLEMLGSSDINQTLNSYMPQTGQSQVPDGSSSAWG